VVLFDFPLTVIDYLHRVGRTARIGKPGKVTALITKRDRALANHIMVLL
jgi:superfamily II DNA/RNA helicase